MGGDLFPVHARRRASMTIWVSSRSTWVRICSNKESAALSFRADVRELLVGVVVRGGLEHLAEQGRVQFQLPGLGPAGLGGVDVGAFAQVFEAVTCLLVGIAGHGTTLA
ncbi:hypothetical protein [Streptacidiphilus sp. P02-A3a]|uniref:hypothetical protein n=1 Tax=Streptacidiphilus sp. P02-A3a TaxID=2704468 RepID=UPI0015FE34DD|nr:hypothetical protein [Streptacidiphilus sp. P02-A3a]QMU70268.1 hypothetical protein GXP74_20655 [Streptacidiphilus sp. P02-A3a]